MQPKFSFVSVAFVPLAVINKVSRRLKWELKDNLVELRLWTRPTASLLYVPQRKETTKSKYKKKDVMSGARQVRWPHLLLKKPRASRFTAARSVGFSQDICSVQSFVCVVSGRVQVLLLFSFFSFGLNSHASVRITSSSSGLFLSVVSLLTRGCFDPHLTCS